MKKPVIMCVMDDDRDSKLAQNFKNSIRKFHDNKQLPIKLIRKADNEEYNADQNFYYRAKAIIAKDHIDDYELVIVADADQICLGSLDFVIGSQGWDIGTVLNWNRVDPEKYGLVTVFNINPQNYFNAGLIAFRSKEVVEHLDMLCHGPYFSHPTMRYREQDLLNIMCHYGNYKVKCFDVEDSMYGYNAWHGLIAKGEGTKMELKDKRVILPVGKDGYPAKEKEIKIYHWAGGGNEIKNHRTVFNEDMIEHIDWLISEEGNK